jgi:predicted DsbA family dithiol-disulfide isomerase
VRIGLWTTIGSALLMVAAACAQGAAPEAGAVDPVVARVGDQVITQSELEAIAGPSLVALRQQIYQTQVAALEDDIFQRLVREAAAKAGVTDAEYRRMRIDEMVTEPDEGEVVKLMTQFRSQLAEDDAQAREQVIQALKQREKQRLAEDLRKVLFEEAGVEILLEPPRVEVAIAEGTPQQGPADAPITLVEYTDYQCPFCKRVQPTLAALLERYDGTIRHVFKNLPLPMHPQAQLAAEAALCAQDQGTFWKFHDWLFENQKTMNHDTMVAAAGELGMNVDTFTACIDGGTHSEQVRADVNEARGFGITGTPGFLINGRVLTGAQPVEQFEVIINEELDRKGIAIPPKEAETAE